MKKILVANRGEIAVRILRTIRKMGLKSVAVFSEADRNAPHVLFADEAVCLGPAASSESYLNIEKIIGFAVSLGVDAIHPGYGFLSENAVFAKRVNDAGMIFIGPGPGAIATMGSKLAAKEAVKKYGIPMVPGTDKAVNDLDEATRLASTIGYPILIKASAGGGGKGMRIVHSADECRSQIERAISEAQSAFGDGSVFMEKYISSPRHIEVQVLADHHGNMVHLFERECSIQRRHQKVIEESPSAIVTPELRKQMGEAALMVARSCGYTSTGTVEFLVDENRKFYFLEMNTRLQVEHPVTEMITGLDLVEEQIRIARGEKLRFKQDDLAIKGHSIELRVYAEDPANDFLPSIGKLNRYTRPAMPGVRVDDGYEEGMTIPVYYDPLLAKLVVHGDDRTDAIAKMKEAIRQFRIDGVSTTLPFGSFVMENHAFAEGDFDTHFVKKHFDTDAWNAGREQKARLAGIIALRFYLDQLKKTVAVTHSSDNWRMRVRD